MDTSKSQGSALRRMAGLSAALMALTDGGASVLRRTRSTEAPRPLHISERPGMKRFEIDGQEVWAINEKNAQRKAAKKNA